MRLSLDDTGSFDLNLRFQSRGIDTLLLIAGIATDVCFESTAQDAVMLKYRVVMVSDADHSWSDEGHTASLDTFVAFFGNVMPTDEVVRQAAMSEENGNSTRDPLGPQRQSAWSSKFRLATDNCLERSSPPSS